MLDCTSDTVSLTDSRVTFRALSEARKASTCDALVSKPTLCSTTRGTCSAHEELMKRSPSGLTQSLNEQSLSRSTAPLHNS